MSGGSDHAGRRPTLHPDWRIYRLGDAYVVMRHLLIRGRWHEVTTSEFGSRDDAEAARLKLSRNRAVTGIRLHRVALDAAALE